MIHRLFLFILFVLFPLSAQNVPLVEFERYDLEDSESNFTKVFADSSGFLWIGTQAGVFRYDGYDFHMFKDELAGTIIMDIEESTDGNIWFATSGGLTRLDPKSWKFDSFYHNPEDPNSLGNSYVNDILFDSKGRCWVVHDTGVDLLDRDSGGFSHFGLNGKYNPSEENGPWGGCLFEDSTGRFWLGYQKTAYLDLFEPETGEFQQFDYRSEYIEEEFIRHIQEWQGKLWVGTMRTGLYTIDMEKGETYHFEADRNNPVALSAEDVHQVFVDSRGQCWIATDNSIGLLNKDLKSITNFYPDNDDPMKMNDGANALTEDLAGNLWIVSWSDLYRTSLNNYSFMTIPTERFTTGLRVDPHGGYWIATLGTGLLHLDENYQRDRTYFEGLKSHSIAYGEDGIFWSIIYGEGGGPYYLPVGEKEFKPYRQSEIDSDLEWAMVVNDNKGRLWALGWQRAFQWNSELGEFTTFTYEESGIRKDFSAWDLRLVFEDSEGDLWIGTANGLFRVKEGSGELAVYTKDPDNPLSISDNIITGMAEGDNGDFWISTFQGLNHFRKDREEFEVVEFSGNPFGDGMASLARDRNGLLWMGTTKGIIRYNPESDKSAYFERTDGVFSADGITCASMDDEGIIYMGGFAGITYFDPQKVDENTYVPPLRLTGYETGDSKEGYISSLSQPDRFALPWTNHSLTLDFSALDLSNPEMISYKVRLAGWDDDWLDLGERHSIRYTNIPGGSYEFLIQATNSHGVWMPEEAWTRIPVQVDTHPARTWWAISSYILFGLILVSVFFLLYRSSQQKKLVRERMVSDRLRTVDNLKDQFLANTTHELRTPLNGIIGLAESLMEKSREAVSENVKKELSLIASSGRRLGFLINDILDLSRLKEGDIILNRGPVDLARLTNTVMVLSRPLLQGKNVELKNMIPDDLAMASGDINRIQQILHNLIGNAVKFTSIGEISVTARLAGPQIEITVSDTGIGIPPDKQDAVWESFQQVDGSESREYSGTGLGLPITKQLVMLHGGEIRLESVPGEGTSFIFTLPVSYEAVAEVRNETIASVLTEGPEMEVRDKDSRMEGQANILLVDDEAVNRHVVQSQLEEQRFFLKSVSSGKEALKSIEEELPDLVLLDIMMPGMDGYEVCEKIRRNYSAGELPVIMVSAKNQVADLVRGLSAGANDFISKPYSGRELIARMERHLEVKAVHSSFGKFVPRDLLKLLGNSNDKKIHRPMTVLLTSFSVNRESEDTEVFSIVSTFLPDVLPTIRENRGIIFRYEGEGILSFFPESPVDALQASLKIEELVGQYNKKQKNKDSLHMESSLHEESLLLGITGDEKFTSELVSSRIIEQTLQLNKLGKLLGSTITTDDTTLPRINGNGKQRLLAYVPDEKKGDYKPVYEILAKENKNSQHKLNSSSEYEEALKSFHELKFDEANALFGSVLIKNPRDRAAEIYKERCLFYMNNPPTGKNVSIM